MRCCQGGGADSGSEPDRSGGTWDSMGLHKVGIVRKALTLNERCTQLNINLSLRPPFLLLGLGQIFPTRNPSGDEKRDGNREKCGTKKHVPLWTRTLFYRINNKRMRYWPVDFCFILLLPELITHSHYKEHPLRCSVYIFQPWHWVLQRLTDECNIQRVLPLVT